MALILKVLDRSLMPYKYQFITRWLVAAPPETVWAVMTAPQDWPQWWPGLLRVAELESGDARGIGTKVEYHWQGVLPYRLIFGMELLERREGKLLSARAFGELDGLGEWRLFKSKDGTLLEYNWQVYTRKWWMNVLHFLLRPLFRYNHDVVMRRGAKGLAGKLGVDVRIIS